MFKKQTGQIFILALIVLAIVMVSTVLMISGSLNFFQNSKYSVESTQALKLAEAGVDQAVASLNATGGSYTPDPSQEVSLGNGTYTLSITSVSSGAKTIQATGYIPNKAGARSKRTVKIQIGKGVGASFNYGLQTGEGGLTMQNNVTINGSIYTNGNIFMNNNAYITGDAYVAGGVQPTADQQHDCQSPNCADFIFGKNVNGNSQLDVGQSFQPSISGPLNKITLKLKKTGNPPDVTVRILADNAGSPDKNQVEAVGTLSSSLVTSQYGFIEVTFTTTPLLLTNTTYWIVIDTSSNSSNFWSWSNDTLSGYTRGQAVWSADWQAKSPVWNSVWGDLNFEIFMGGVSTKLEGSNGAIVYGDAHANTITGLEVKKEAYYQVEQNIVVNGAACSSSNPSCHPGSADPVPQPMPLSDSNISEWQDLAVDTSRGGNTFVGDITNCPATLNQGKYIGSISLPSNCTVVVQTPIWVTGNLTFGGSDTIKLDPAIAGSSGVFIVGNGGDSGFINLSNNNTIVGNGSSGSYLILISMFDTKDDPLVRNAISVNNNGNTGILYSNLGSIYISNNNIFTSITGWKLFLDNNVTLNYDQGLAGTFFSSGPSGAFTVIKGTYQEK